MIQTGKPRQLKEVVLFDKGQKCTECGVVVSVLGYVYRERRRGPELDRVLCPSCYNKNTEGEHLSSS